MTDELFINGEPADKEAGDDITLNYKSNLMGDISKIVASNSLTIRLPKSTHNRRLLDNAAAPAYVSRFRYKQHPARLTRNGVDVVGRGNCVLLDSGNTYEVALYWGVLQQLQTLLDEGKKLNEMDEKYVADWSKDSQTTPFDEMIAEGVGFAEYDCGVANVSRIHYHPSVTAWRILTQIAEEAGLTFEVPTAYAAAMRRIAVPCLTRNATEQTNQDDAIDGTLGAWLSGNYPYLAWSDIPKGNDPRGLAQKGTEFLNLRGNQAPFIHIHLRGTDGGDFSVRIDYPSATEVKELRMYICYDTIPGKLDNQLFAVSSYKCIYGPGYSTLFFRKIDRTLNTSKVKESISIFFTHRTYTSISATIKATAYGAWDDFYYPNVFPIFKNLPDITQVDFIKAICGMLGLYVLPDPTNANRLRFYSLEMLCNNKTAAIDWSGRLLAGDASFPDEPDTVSYKVGEFAQNNRFKYKEDNDVRTNGDGIITVDNVALDIEKDAITLPFSASDGDRILQYSINEDDELEYKNVSPRIMLVEPQVRERDGETYEAATLTFTGLGFPDLLNKYYKALRDMLDTAITLKVKMRLTEIDLRTLDYGTPIYLRQYGRYYGIVSVQAPTNMLCTVELVQLPLGEYNVPPIGALTVNRIGYTERDEEDVYAELYIVTEYPTAADIAVDFRVYLNGDDNPAVQTVTMRAGEREVFASHKYPGYEGFEIVAVRPDSDALYSYENVGYIETESMTK